jgi:hypothetical protein
MSKLTDDEIMSMWRTVRPNEEQYTAMTYRDGNLDRPRVELWRLVELAMKVGIERNQKTAAINSPMLMTNEDLVYAIYAAEERANVATETGKAWMRHFMDLLHAQLDRARAGSGGAK